MAVRNAMGGFPAPEDPPIAVRCSLLAAEAVKFAVPDAADKRLPLVPARQACYLNTVPISVTQRAFHPFGLIFERRHSLATPSLMCVCPAHTATDSVSLTEGSRQLVRLADTLSLMRLF